MLMVVTENDWSYIIYEYAVLFESFLASAIFFNSFYLLIKHIILSLLTGLIWEIFTIISNNLGKKKKATGAKKVGKAVEADPKVSEGSLSSDASVVAEDPSFDGDIDPRRLMKIRDPMVLFVRKRLKESKINNLKNQEVSIERDEFSFQDRNRSFDDVLKESGIE